MRKTILATLISITAIAGAFASIIPSLPSPQRAMGTVDVTFNCSNMSNSLLMFSSSDVISNYGQFPCGSYVTSYDTPEDTYTFVEYTGDHSSDTLAEILASPDFVSSIEYYYCDSCEIASSGEVLGAFASFMSSSTSAFNDETGFSMANIVTWSADTLIKPIMGTGMAVLYVLRFWIIALVVISAIVYFSYRAFRFFKH